MRYIYIIFKKRILLTNFFSFSNFPVVYYNGEHLGLSGKTVNVTCSQLKGNKIIVGY